MSAMSDIRNDLAGLLQDILPTGFTVRQEIDVRAHLSTQATTLRRLMGTPTQYAELRYQGPGGNRLALKRGQVRRAFAFVLDVWYEYQLDGETQQAWDAIIEGTDGIIPTFAGQPKTQHAQVDALIDTDVRIETMDPGTQMYAHRLTTTVNAKQR